MKYSFFSEILYIYYVLPSINISLQKESFVPFPFVMKSKIQARIQDFLQGGVQLQAQIQKFDFRGVGPCADRRLASHARRYRGVWSGGPPPENFKI
jgi:hypothetical protein